MDHTSSDFINNIKFTDFCDVCDKVRSKKEKKIKSEILRRYILYLRTNSKGGNLYQIIRLMLPYYDRDRGSYGIKEDKLGHIYVKVLDLAKTGKDAVALLEYRHPNRFKFNQAVTDYADIVYGVMKSRSTTPSNLTIADVNKALDAIAKSFAEKSSEAKLDVFFDTFIGKMSAKEQKWIIRIILKSMHFGVGHKQMLYFIHPDAFKFISTNFSLQKLCSTLGDPNVRYNEFNINLFEAFRPMLSSKCNIETINFSGDHFIETKLDGERYQIHYSDGEFKFFSRNGFEASTYIYGSNVSTGYFAASLKEQFSPHFTSFILDGEMMAWHKVKKCLITQGNFRDVGKVKVGGDVQPCFFPFDIVYCNGKVITNKPLFERVALLKQVFTPKEGVIMELNRISVKSNDEILDALNKAIEKREEGIIVKEVNSIYKPNERFSGGWYKIKPEYTQGALMELDVLIIGGNFGSGQLKGTVSRFLVGLAASKDSDGTPNEFHSLTMVSSGLTFDELDEVRSKLNTHWIAKKKPPTMIQFGHTTPDVHIDPKNSIILQVKASQIIKSSKFKCGFSLRFPRVEKVRFDKSWKDCLTSEEFYTIYNETAGMLTSGPLSSKSEHKTRKRKNLHVLPHFQKPNLRGVDVIANLFQNKRISVTTGTKQHSKADMEKLIFKHGGKIAAMPDSKTFCIVVGDNNVRTKNFISSKKHIVTNHMWVLDCIQKNKLLPWEPVYLLGMTQLCESDIMERFDIYGDGYWKCATKKSLDFSLNCPQMIKSLKKPVSPEDLNEMLDLLLDDANFYSCFKNCCAFFAEDQEHYEMGQNMANLSLKEEMCCFKFLSGTISQEVNIETDYIVVHKRYKINNTKLFDLKIRGSFSTVIVSNEWLQKSWEEKKWLDHSPYIITDCEDMDVN
ncbi:DNA ligase 4 isoform X1 [Cimex lectularius]|uniref:DNA ligase 4 n=1 Tax=Cimex lectularius TaxID=79782 RepID=A0A8I6RH62_CIMLE|nr:DNA ligase 4 isoform X1 [Cimex lectularius]XP_014246177.1 DNA ligase 4 isoform X1 [Cimex lectularius]XP_024083877.1 DNA ligase 4 isoform X1 [Cimex lectularius]